MFLDTAARCLAANGRLVIVTKDPAWHEEQMERLIGPVEAVTRGGYAVLQATRRTDGKEQ
jgi:16S rRNA G1207 methylase RsmC